MSVEAESLLQEVKECIEAAQNYRSELQQRLQGLSQARKQVNPHTPQSFTANQSLLTDQRNSVAATYMRVSRT